MCSLRGHAAAVLSVAFSPGGGRIVSGSGKGSGLFSEDRVKIWDVKIWDAETGTEVSAGSLGPLGLVCVDCFVLVLC